MRVCWLVMVALAGCTFRPGEVPAVCGNGIVERDEACDDGNTEPDPACDGSCQLTCGNGVIDTDQGEVCDPGDPAGCPTSCDDGVACTSDVLSGADCTAACLHSTITAPADGDGCCPVGASVQTDSDCAPGCGNGAVDAGESCDTGIAPGNAGACPTTCDDLQACTTDVLANAGTCMAACSSVAITMPINGDGCCPTGANTTNDSDCTTTCGDGVLESGEACDTGIASGAGSCPTSCMDGNACTQDVLSNAGTCAAQCNFPPITMAVNGDGCCPQGANANTDTDCTPMCGNGVREGTEQCDDGNNTQNDGCTNQCTLNPTAFRFTDLDLRDPHVFNNFGLGCADFTDSLFGYNSGAQDAIRNDRNNDGRFDSSPTLVFRPLVQTSGATTPVAFYPDASCTTGSPVTCTAAGTPATLAATNLATGTCLAPLAGTTFGYMPGIVAPTGPCFSTTPGTLTVTMFGSAVPVTDVRLGATYVGAPATGLANGLLIAFLSEATASSITITGGPFNNRKLSSLIAGGTGNCASHSDKDVNNGVSGWWFYYNFPATEVGWGSP